MSRPRLLDLFCGAGGAAMGYHRAGFDVVGVDIKPQPRYPFEFFQGDALTFPLEGFDAIHASPPCQAYSQITRARGDPKSHPDLIEPTRRRLQASGLPWIIENVPGSPMSPDFVLCGSAFGLEVRRHRFFITSWGMSSLVPSCNHSREAVGVYGKGPARYLNRWTTPKECADAMGIDWMDRPGLVNAIPPAYTEFIGRQLIEALPARVTA